MKRVLVLFSIFLLFLTISHSRIRSRNFSVNKYTVTSTLKTVVTPNISGTLWIQTNQDIYMDLETSATPDATSIFLKADQDRDYWPLHFGNYSSYSTELALLAVSDNATVTVIWMDQ